MDYERAARIYCEEMGLDPDERDYFDSGALWKCSRIEWAAIRLREHHAMNKALELTPKGSSDD